jgi:hypothetical protein
MGSKLINNKKINGGIVSSPGKNVTLWYKREANEQFSINGSFNGLETTCDWVLIKDIDSKWVKSGVMSFNSERKTATVKFSSPFVNDEYYIFILCNTNTSLYWANKKKDQFTIIGTMPIGSEVSWLAIHKKIGQQTGIRTPKSLYAGQRIISTNTMQWNGAAFEPGDNPLNEPILPLPADSTGSAIGTPFCSYDSALNLNGWYKSELIIKPSTLLDGISANNYMNFTQSSDYSVIISSDFNINTYWINKRSDRVKIGTSYPTTCIIHYLFVKTGLNWWDEI